MALQLHILNNTTALDRMCTRANSQYDQLQRETSFTICSDNPTKHEQSVVNGDYCAKFSIAASSSLPPSKDFYRS